MLDTELNGSFTRSLVLIIRIPADVYSRSAGICLFYIVKEEKTIYSIHVCLFCKGCNQY